MKMVIEIEVNELNGVGTKAGLVADILKYIAQALDDTDVIPTRGVIKDIKHFEKRPVGVIKLVEGDTDLTTFNGRLHNASDVDDKCKGYKSLGG